MMLTTTMMKSSRKLFSMRGLDLQHHQRILVLPRLPLCDRYQSAQMTTTEHSKRSTSFQLSVVKRGTSVRL